MAEGAMLRWSPVDWEDPAGGVIRLWPFLPSVVLPASLRRSIGAWDGLAFLLPDDEPQIWQEQADEEKVSAGINRDAICVGGGILARMMIGMTFVEGVQAARFPDPEPRRLLLAAESSAGHGQRPVFFVEPEDEEWIEWVEACADEMVRIRQLIASVFGGRAWRKELKRAMRATRPPIRVRDEVAAQGLAEASSLAATWWWRAEAVLNEEIIRNRDARLAGRLRGALAQLREGQVDGRSAPVLLVPIMQAWLPTMRSALKRRPKAESIEPEEEEE